MYSHGSELLIQVKVRLYILNILFFLPWEGIGSRGLPTGGLPTECSKKLQRQFV